MDALAVTPAQRRAAIEALGLDPDMTASLSLTSDWINARVIETDEAGAPVVADGRMLVRDLSGPIRELEVES